MVNQHWNGVAVGFFLLLASGLCQMGCKESVPSDAVEPAGTFDQAALLRNVAEVIAARTVAAATAAQALQGAVDSYAATPSIETLSSAQTAWLETMAAWQQVDALQVGPVAPVAADAAGQGLRDAIYSWPAVNSCRVDQDTADGDYAKSDFIDTALVNSTGLDALEYLLFTQSLENTCQSNANLNTNGSWVALMNSPGEIEARRAAYATVLAQAVADKTAQLASLWSDGDASFASKLGEPGTAESPYRSHAEALDALFRGLYYVELTVKDRKLGVPTGLLADCPASSCPNELEARWADQAREHVSANLLAFEWAFYGGNPTAGTYGFDDALIELGASQQAAEAQELIAAARSAVDGFDGSFHAALVANPRALDAVYNALKALADFVRGELVTWLMLTIPAEGAGDND